MLVHFAILLFHAPAYTHARTQTERGTNDPTHAHIFLEPPGAASHD